MLTNFSVATTTSSKHHLMFLSSSKGICFFNLVANTSHTNDLLYLTQIIANHGSNNSANTIDSDGNIAAVRKRAPVCIIPSNIIQQDSEKRWKYIFFNTFYTIWIPRVVHAVVRYIMMMIRTSIRRDEVRLVKGSGGTIGRLYSLPYRFKHRGG